MMHKRMAARYMNKGKQLVGIGFVMNLPSLRSLGYVELAGELGLPHIESATTVRKW